MKEIEWEPHQVRCRQVRLANGRAGRWPLSSPGLAHSATRRPEETGDKFQERYSGWEQRRNEVDGLAEIIIAKQRHGPTGKVPLRFHAMVTKFDNLEEGAGDYAGDGPGEDVPF